MDTSLVQATLNKIHISPRKLGLLGALIRQKSVNEAIKQLRFSRKGVAPLVAKLLHSAVSNAENNHQKKIDRLFVEKVLIGKTLTMRRFHPRARGRSNSIRKPLSKITVFLKEV